MKLFKNHFLLGLIMTVPFIASCSNDDDVQATDKPEEITITADVPSQNATRVNFDKEGLALSWKDGDAFQVSGAADGGHQFNYGGNDEQGRGKFTGTKPAAGDGLYAFYPASKSSKSGRNSDLFDYTGQTQQGNDNVDNLADYLYLTGTVNPADYTVSDFVLQPAILKLTINMPETFSGVVSSVAVSLQNAKFNTKQHIQAGLDVEDDRVASMSMTLSDVTLNPQNQLIVYLAISPLNVVDPDVFTLTVADTEGAEYISVLENFTYDFMQGKVCPAVLNVEKKNETNVTFDSTDYSSDQPLDKATGWIGYKSATTYVDYSSSSYAGLNEALKLGKSDGYGKIKLDVTANTTKMRFFVIPFHGNTPQVVVSVQDADGVKTALQFDGQSFIDLYDGDKNSNVCMYGGNINLANWNDFTAAEGVNMFIIDVAGYDKVFIEGSSSVEYKKNNFGVFGIQFK